MIKLYSPKHISWFLVSAAVAGILLTGCRKNSGDGSMDPSTPPDLTTMVRSSLSGFVTDENNLPVNLATVQVGTSTITTDKYGYFEIKNIDVIKDAATVTVTKSGYFKGIKTYIAAEGKPAFFRIKLIPKTNSGTFNSGSGGGVTLSNGLSITLPANAVVNASSNTAYTGTVNVAAYWINPASSDLPNNMPGDLRGINTAGNAQLLTTYGMAAIELRGSGGEFLQIAAGKKATLSLPIPSSLSSSAPAAIPLWYFDETKGLWIQEGTATKTGNNYVGEVSHFSFWNVDVPESFVQLSCTLVDPAAQPIQNAVVKISVINNPANFRYGYTNASGYVSGPVPANSQLLFEVFSSAGCSTPLYSQNVTTATTNIPLGMISLVLPNSLAMITGTVVNCSNTPVTNGYVMVIKDNNHIRLNLSNTGSYTGTIPVCNNTGSSVTFIAEDLATNMTSGPVVRSLVSGPNTVPPIQVCSAPQQEYVNFIKNGVPESYHYLFLSQATSNPLSYGIFFYLDPAHTIYRGFFQISQTGIATGSTQTLLGIATGGTGLPNMVISNPPVNVNITEYGGVGQYIAGNFTGTFLQPPSNVSYTITGNFRIKRTF